MKIEENVLISSLTTMRLGGPARYVITIAQIDEVEEAYAFAKEKNLPIWVMGGGANTIGRDEGFEGIILLNRLYGMEVMAEEAENIIIKGMGGEVWDDFVGFCTSKGFSGIEAMSAIPGTLGAAPVQNIGAYGQELSQVILSVEAYDSWEEKMVEIPADEMQLEYRKSIFNSGEQVGRYFITSVTVRLRKTELRPPFYTSLQKYVDDNGETDFSPENIRRMVTIVRDGKLPNPKLLASAGSFFENVYVSDAEAEVAREKGIQVWRENGKNIINSGWLIEQCGLKGKELHGMRVSDKAALVLINEKAKNYADLAAAREEIKKAVREKFGYELEQEPMEIY